jgi:FMN phosphatase YigB (HAD superfamily)
MRNGSRFRGAAGRIPNPGGVERHRMRAYTALIFDLFDTVIDFRRDRMPMISVNGTDVRSTSHHVYERFRSVVPDVPFEAFYTAFMEGYREVERIRARELREIPSAHRFELILSKLAVQPDDVPAGFPEWLAEVHMAKLSEAMDFPQEHGPLLEWARSRYRLGMISNFDHAPTARGLLEQHGVIGHFEQVVISAEEGIRKPHPEIFHRTLARMSLTPRDALFIGDSPGLDVVGAKGVGMDVAWLNRDGEALGEGIPAPDYTIARLTDLPQLL